MLFNLIFKDDSYPSTEQDTIVELLRWKDISVFDDDAKIINETTDPKEVIRVVSKYCEIKENEEFELGEDGDGFEEDIQL